MITQTTLTSAEIDALNYDAAVSEVRTNGHKGTWIASAKLDTLKKVLKGEMTPTDAAIATISGGVTITPAPAPAPVAPVSLDGIFGAAVSSAVNAQMGSLQQRLDDIAAQIGGVPQGIEDRIDAIQSQVNASSALLDLTKDYMQDIKSKVDAALQQGGTAAAKVIAPVLGLAPTGTADPVTRALDLYCAPGNALKPVLIKGGPGAGKTFGARMHGNQFDRYVEAQITPDTEASDLLGWPSPTTPWIDGPLTEAFRIAAAGKSVLFVADELFRGRGGAVQVLLTLLTPFQENGEYWYRLRTGKPVVDPVTGSETSEEIKAPKRLLSFVATTNVGGKFDVQPPDPAVKERFVPVHVEVEETKLRRVLTSYTDAKGFYPSVVDSIAQFWNTCKILVKDNFLEQLPSTRILSEAVLYSANEEDVPHRILDMGLHIWVAETIDGLPEPEQCKRVVDALRGAFPCYAPQPTGDPTVDQLILA
jgi:hypothetical protein